jgi:CheY-like chemotaxis protein
MCGGYSRIGAMKRVLLVDDEPELTEVVREYMLDAYDVVTANSGTAALADVVQECLRTGAFAYVPKPFDLNYVEHMAALATQAPRRTESA